MSQSQGTLASGLYGSAEQLVICDEMVHMIKRVLNGFSVTKDTLALDVIRSVKPGGTFIMEDHTLAHFKSESFFPLLFRRQSEDDWLKRGGKPILDFAHQRVEEVRSQSNPVALSRSADKALQAALEKAVSS
jgi:trimethylamine--corrinoid protein Co-methyltransferase